MVTGCIRNAYLFLAYFLGSLSSEAGETNLMRLDDCLHEPSVINQYSRIDWLAVRSQRDLEECSFEMAQRLASKEALMIWFDNNGFETSAPQEISSNAMQSSFGIEEVGWIVGASQSKRNIQLRLGPIDRFFIHGLSIGVYLSATAEPIRVQSSFTRK